MTRRVVWSLVACLTIVVLGGVWFLSNFEQVPVKERTNTEREARRNPYLALERLMGRLGRPMKRESNALFLDRLPQGGALILDRNRRHFMAPARVDRLLAWVESGGYLLLVPEFRGTPDPVLDRLKLRWFVAPASRQGQAQTPNPDAEDNCQCKTMPKVLTVRVPGSEKTLNADFNPGLQAGALAPAWHAGEEGYGDQILHFDRGRGHITVLTGFGRIYANGRIGERDHAELLWTLLTTYQPAGDVIMMSQLAVPNLWDWLVETAWTAGIAACVLLGLWLWRTMPRFGPAAPEPPPNRRELREHLAALGRYVWRSGGLEHWLRVAREDFAGRLALRHPHIAAMPPGEQAAALAKMTARPATLIAAALAGPADTPHAFTAALRTLKNLEQTL